ncbi:hypothetical protein [Thermococcus gorgonarius]|uniref:Uncharacterized protein n=1 Tax=Thermococcus gorgonarius TaxID=71997 RepID=A0A2Z2M8D8_THEGO|nr:hypothetical protein [Thermococcus gorgonarius]ASJ00725.1 hypothetical protein A3K92_04150 [Thermococcus gorgonarius]
MIVESLVEYARRGRVDVALKYLREEEDPIIKAELLSEMLKSVERIEDYLVVKRELIKTVDYANDRKERAILLSIIGETLISTGEETEGVKFLKEAIKTAQRVPIPLWRAEALTGVGINLAKAGFYEDAYDLFTKAFEALIIARESGTKEAIPLASRIARSIVGAVDFVDDGHWAILFFRLAAEIYDFIGLRFPATLIRAKERIIERAIDGDLVYLRRLLAEDRIDDAILLTRYLPLEYRPLGLLEVAFWLYSTDHPELAKPLFDEAYETLRRIKSEKGTINELGISSIAIDFVKLGKPELASKLAGLIDREDFLSEVLSRVAVAHYRSGDEFLARAIAHNIPDESIKRKTLQLIGGEAHVGYEQGLPVVSGGEKR